MIREPMEADLCRGAWQVLPEMRASLAAELAGASAGLWLVCLWHMHAARRAAETGGPRAEVVRRAQAGLDAANERAEVDAVLRRQGRGGAPCV